ncbi:hypothetical protein PSEUDO8Z_60492 [Pseudomonas sp. 8Z]|nr:hypothetical protein PSEUDO8Z_60492 [Pseudomonas sp. 8Z]
MYSAGLFSRDTLKISHAYLREGDSRFSVTHLSSWRKC